jgi:general stress protein YciG
MEAHSTGRERSKRGFASMDAAKQREIARKGGESVPPEKRSFSRDHALAAQAGRKGGQSVPAAQRSFSKDHKLAAEAGREGGKRSHGGRSKAAQPGGVARPSGEKAD